MRFNRLMWNALAVTLVLMLSACGGNTTATDSTTAGSLENAPDEVQTADLSGSSESDSADADEQAAAASFASGDPEATAYLNLDDNPYANPASMEDITEFAGLIDVSVLDPVATQGSADVGFSEMSLDEGHFSSGSLMSIDINGAGQDAIVLFLSNNGAEDVSEVKAFIVGWIDDGTSTQIGGGMNTLNMDIFNLNYEHNEVIEHTLNDVLTITWSMEDQVLPAGKGGYATIRCDLSTFSGFRMIVASWVTADGVEHENPAAQEWVQAIAESVSDQA